MINLLHINDIKISKNFGMKIDNFNNFFIKVYHFYS